MEKEFRTVSGKCRNLPVDNNINNLDKQALQLDSLSLPILFKMILPESFKAGESSRKETVGLLSRHDSESESHLEYTDSERFRDPKPKKNYFILAGWLLLFLASNIVSFISGLKTSLELARRGPLAPTLIPNQGSEILHHKHNHDKSTKDAFGTYETGFMTDLGIVSLSSLSA